jgi:outer membrane protein TolC
LLSPGAQPRLDNVSSLALLIFVCFLPTAAVFAAIGLWRAARRLAEARYQAPPAQPIERLQADLRRLRAELEDTESRSGLTAKNHRVQALRGAYVDALSAACERLDVSPPSGGDRAPLTEIYRVEAALRRRGLDVRQDERETAAH